ncbi:MAG: mechanosensitive ion channel family protein [Leptospiraceae bacterium]|nr:mechanosensitive ion channel family protein [Leptospiraceae bacterium]MCP5498546.1 mechanosensitive ion channel family protein [Leptospiraceae bacterium]
MNTAWNKYILMFFCFLFLIPGVYAEDKKQEERLIQRLVEVKTDSPRDTMRTFMTAMNDYKKGVDSGDIELKERIKVAIRCLDLEDTPYLLREEKGSEIAIFLKEVIDRVIIIKYEYIPEKPESNRWRLRNTEITISKVEKGERAGEWLFSPATTYRARDFYQKVKSYPYLKGSGAGAAYKAPWLRRIIPAWARAKVLGSHIWQWLGILIAILLGYLIRLLIGLATKLFLLIASKTNNAWDDRIASAISGPLGYIAAVGFWYFCLKYLQIEGILLTILDFVLNIQLSVFAIWMLYRLMVVFSEFVEVRYKDADTHFRAHLLPLILKTAKVLVVILGILVSIQNMGYNVMSILAGLGIGGLAFALAAKDTAANLFGSLMILFDKPFKAGDWIVLGSYEGVVEEIGLRSTRIRTFYDSVVSIPNSDMANTRIDNMGLRQYRRILTKIGIEYGTAPNTILEFVRGIKEIIERDPETRKDKFYINFTSFGAYSLEILLYCYVQVPGYAEELVAKERIYLEIIDLADRLGVGFAFPTQTVHLSKEKETENFSIPKKRVSKKQSRR